MSGKDSKPTQPAQPSLLDRYVTTVQPDKAIPTMRVCGYKLIGCTTEGYPLFEAVKGSLVQEQPIYETPLFEEFIPETFH